MPKCIVVILLLSVAPICVCSAKLRQSESTAPNQLGTDRQPLVIKSIPLEPSAQDLKHDAEHRRERAEDRQDRVVEEQHRDFVDYVTIGTGLTTILILVVQAIAFFVQARELRASVNEMQRATNVAQASAESAKSSADAAVNANELTRGALRAHQNQALMDEFAQLELQHLVWCLRKYIEMGGSPMISELYRRRYDPIVCWLYALGILTSLPLEEHFKPEEFRTAWCAATDGT